MPACEALHDKVEEPEPPVIVVGDNEQDRFVELVATASVTVSVNPFCGVTVIVDVPVTPALTATLVRLAVTVKVGALTTW